MCRAKRTTTLEPCKKLFKSNKEIQARLNREALEEFARNLLLKESCQADVDRILYARNVLLDMVKRNMICSEDEVITIIKAVLATDTYTCGIGVTSATVKLPEGKFFID